WRAPPNTSATTPSSDARRGNRRPRASGPYEPHAGADGEERGGAPLEPPLRIDELRLEEVDRDAKLQESPVVRARLEPARRAFDLPERIRHDAGRNPHAARR